MRRKNEHGQPGVSRRTFFKRTSTLSLGLLGLPDRAAGRGAMQQTGPPSVAPAAVLEPCQAAPPAYHGSKLRGLDLPTKHRDAEGRFGLMFKRLPAFTPPDELLTTLGITMHEDPGTDFDDNDRLNDNASPLLTSGFTFLGQFIDHDLTFDTTPLPDQQVDPDAVTNFRSARYDLDSLYGRGPVEDPHLYDPADPAKLLSVVNANGVEDVPRQPDGRALIADPRNDQHLIICQLHLAMMQFHNRLVDLVREQGGAADQVFAEARRLARWYYQWVVIHDFLPRIVGQALLDQLLDERSGKPPKVKLAFYKPKNPHHPMLPVEFAVAAYRFGHSITRPRYTIKDGVSKVPLFEAVPSENNLNGGRPIPARLQIDWSKLFGAGARPVRKIDAKLAAPLFILPTAILPEQDTPQTLLSVRNLLRGKRLGLPSGQQVAQAMGIAPLANADLGLSAAGWQGEAPLWYYILK